LGWFEDEPRLGQAAGTILDRLTSRAKASWPVWVSAAALLSAAATYRASRAPISYSSQVVLRVTEGRVEIPGAKLGAGRLRAYVDNLALTNKNLLELMGRHGHRFGEKADPASALEDFRQNLEVGIHENDFNEERGADDPPRSARLEIKFRAADPELAYAVAQELTDLVTASAFGRERQVLEQERDAATIAAKRAEDDLAALAGPDPMGFDPHTSAAGQRAAYAKAGVAEAVTALRALSEKQVLRFEVVDAGRVAPTIDRVSRLLAPLLLSLLGGLLGGALLAGAYDPRVVDERDLTDLGSAVLGRIPALPFAPRTTGRHES